MKDSRGHFPNGAWVFDQAVTDCFDDMLGRSIPRYRDMRVTVSDLARRFIEPYSTVLDLGCSHGEMIQDLLSACDPTVKFHGCDVSPPMVEAARARFGDSSRVYIEALDLRERFPDVGFASVVLSVLTLQFIAVNYRQRILADVYNVLQREGALIFVEKVLGAGSMIDSIQVKSYHALKVVNGYTAEEVEAKRQSIEGVLVPLTAPMNEQLLRGAGFREVDCFWRWHNFAAWVAVK